jgi:PAS domain S-box-containing protein
MPSIELQRIFDACPNGILLTDREGRILAANASSSKFLDIAGDLPQHLVRIEDLFESRNAELILEQVHALLVDEISNSTELTSRNLELCLCADGFEDVWVDVSLCLFVLAEANSPSSMRTVMLVLTDITRFRSKEAELQQRNEKLLRDVSKLTKKMREESRQARLNYEVACEQILLAREEKKLADELGARWRSLTENAPQIVMLLDRKGRVQFCNRMSAEADPQMPDSRTAVRDFIPGHESRLTRRVVDEVLKGKLNKEYEVDGTDAEGQPAWHWISVGPVVTKSGERSDSVVLIATDITQRKLAEESVVKHQEELAHVSRLASMGALTVELAHELNQPLGVIGNYVGGCIIGLGRPDWDRDRIVHAQKKILGETRRAREITLRILDFLRRRESPRMLTDINWLVQDTMPLADLEAQKHQVMLANELQPNLPDVKVNRVQIQQIVINLISNAVHSVVAAAPAKPQVVITTRLLDVGGIEVCITDNGAGFNQKSVDELFVPLYTTKEKGTGMGLSICRTLVELHGGRITATGRPGSGASFSFTVPVYDPKAEELKMQTRFSK